MASGPIGVTVVERCDPTPGERLPSTAETEFEELDC